MPTFLKPLNGDGSGLNGLGVANLTAFTGTPSATTFARGDGSWETPAAGGGAAYSATIGDGTTTAIVVTHNLGTQDVAVAVREAASPYGLVAVRWEATTANTVTLQFTTAPTTGQYRASVLSGAAAGGGGGGGAPTTSTYVLNTADATLPNAQALGALATGLVKVATTTGVLSTAAAGTDYVAPAGSITGTAGNITGIVAIANGGTNAATAAAALGNLAAAGTGLANSFSQAQTLAGGATVGAVPATVGGVAATTASSVTVNTKNVTATLLGAATGTLTIPANFLVVGRTLRFSAYGTATTTTTTPATLTFKALLGGVAVATTVAYTPASAATNVGWSADVILTCRTTGATGTVFTQGSVTLMLTTAAISLGMPGTAATTINTTAAAAFDFQVTESNATNAQTVTCTHYVLEALN